MPEIVCKTRVDGSFNGWNGDTIYKLENGQIWRQAQYYYCSFYANHPETSIVLSKDGDYEMRVEGCPYVAKVVRLG